MSDYLFYYQYDSSGSGNSSECPYDSYHIWEPYLGLNATSRAKYVCSKCNKEKNMTNEERLMEISQAAKRLDEKKRKVENE